MRATVRFLITSLLSIASLYAVAFQLQQTPSSIQTPELAKGPNTLSSNYVVRDLHNNIGDTVTVITRDTSFMQIDTKLKIAALRLKEKTASIAEYVKANNFNEEYCFLVDMSIPSGKNRFFVYNIRTGTVELSSLVSHGMGSWKKGCNDQLTFSNMPNSNATSLGKYKIGQSYYGTYGLSYKLFGLDSTNSNAIERSIVLHSDSYVPEKECYPYPLYQSQGCPIVSPTILSILGKYIKRADKPMLLWIYN